MWNLRKWYDKEFKNLTLNKFLELTKLDSSEKNWKFETLHYHVK